MLETFGTPIWIAVALMELCLGAFWYRDEIAIFAFRKRWGLEKKDKGLAGTIEGVQVDLPNIRHANEDVVMEIRGGPPGVVRQLRAPRAGDRFTDLFAHDGRPDIRYGVWDARAEALAVELASFGAVGMDQGTLTFQMPHLHKSARGHMAVRVAVQLGQVVKENAAGLKASLERSLDAPEDPMRRVGALEGMFQRGWAERAHVTRVLEAVLASMVPEARTHAARLIVTYPDIPESLVVKLAEHAPADAWPTEGPAAFHGYVAAARIRLHIPEPMAIAWLTAPHPEVLERTIDDLGSRDTVSSLRGLGTVLTSGAPKPVKDHAREAMKRVRGRLVGVDAGQLALLAAEGGELAEVASGGELAEAATAGALAVSKEPPREP